MISKNLIFKSSNKSIPASLEFKLREVPEVTMAEILAELSVWGIDENTHDIDVEVKIKVINKDGQSDRT